MSSGMKSFLGGQKIRKLATYHKDKVNSYIVDDKTTLRNKKRLWKKLLNERMKNDNRTTSTRSS